MFASFFAFTVGIVLPLLTPMLSNVAAGGAPTPATVEMKKEYIAANGNKYLLLNLIGGGDAEEFLRKIANATTLAEGRVTELSSFPDPAAADYPDCYYTARITLEGIFSGNPIERNIVLVMPAFANRKKSDVADFIKGEKRSLRIIPLADLPEEMQSIQIADDIGAFELDYFFLLDTETIGKFTEGEYIVPFTSGNVYESPFDNPSAVGISAKAVAAKEQFIARELEYVNSRLAELPEDLGKLDVRHRTVWGERQKDFAAIPGNFTWGRVGRAWLGNNARQTLIGKRKLNIQAVESIISLKDFLEVKGVQLIVQIVPNYHAVATRYINEEFRNVVDYEAAVMAKILLEAGVETMYTSDEMVKRLGDYELSFFYPRDHHPAEGAVDVMTDLILPRMERFEFAPDLDPKRFSVTRRKGIYAEAGAMQPALRAARELLWEDVYNISAPVVLYDGNFLPPNAASEVLILGNSFAGSPTRESSYPTFFAHKTNYNPAIMISFGSGLFNTLPRRLFDKSEEYLAGKRVAIFLVGVDFMYRDTNCLNLHELDRELRILQNRALIGEITIPAGDEQNYKDTMMRQSSGRQTDWQGFASESESVKFALAAKGDSLTVLNIDDLGNRFDVSQEIVAVVTTATMPPTLAQIEVNGEVRNIPSYVLAQWQRMLFILPPNSGTLQVKLMSDTKDAVIAIQDILLYQ